ncbi:NADP/FAD dependent oxidoreductase [Ceraceosorus bombacis]|uniref:assimilatory sulfite reductase (NADPH) n=1 Tax=Ceraceosorus bombacis TaxID=401625 RepID=A0A0P1BJ08_9BASI|nr:NADP/FAD dependent oxidoreductase [Ceraceosorus bombacis]
MATVHANAPFGTAAIFAGGLAVGIGGALALSRASFAPSRKVTRSTRDKAAKVLGGGSARSADETTKLDDVDPTRFGADAAKPALSKKEEAAQPAKLVAQELGVVPNSQLAQDAARILDTRMNLSGPVINSSEEVASKPDAPVWLTGLPQAELKATSAGLIEQLAYRSSNSLFVYESATNAGFGAWAEREAKEAAAKGWVAGRPRVFSLQTRGGAGNAIAGYVAEKGTTSGAPAGLKKVVSALTNAQGLVAMAPTLAALPPSDSRLVIHASAASQAVDHDDNLRVANDYASVLGATAALTGASPVGAPDFAVILSAGRQEAVDVAASIYEAGTQEHAVHVFDGAYSAREVAALSEPTLGSGVATSISAALGRRGLSHFDYYGAADATSVIVVPNGSHASAARALLSQSGVADKVGILAVRVLRPWSDDDLLTALPASAKRVFVVDELRSGVSGVLFDDVQAALLNDFTSGIVRAVQPLAFSAGQTISAGQWVSLLRAAAAGPISSLATVFAESVATPAGLLGAQRVVSFLDGDASPTSYTGRLLARALRSRTTGEGSRIISRFDNFSVGGVVRSDVVIGNPGDDIFPAHLATEGGIHALVVGDISCLKGVNAFGDLASGATVILNAPGWEVEEVSTKLSPVDLQALASARARVFLVDATATADKLAGGAKSPALTKEVAAAVLLAVYLNAHSGLGLDDSVVLLQRILGVAPLGPGGLPALVEAAHAAVQPVQYEEPAWASTSAVANASAAASVRASAGRYNSFTANLDAAALAAADGTIPTSRATWALPAWQNLFSEAYGLDAKSLRPDLHEQTWVVKVTENRRLTPVDYDRNVFHMELSTAGTDLKYEVGEALGVHGWNDEQEVKEFLEWYGAKGDEVISIPSLNDSARFETRTVFQLLQQRLDIFGKPGKRFYEFLGQVAKDRDDARWLKFIAAAEGNATFKKLSEVETVTYADVLRMFPSARPSLEQLLTEVSPIEPRHYSIASAQSAVGESVHLLVVTVDWLTPSGSPRFGQCTRYLTNLKVGDQVTVSLKPSIMKLPPLTTQPIIMAGLGTGAAPFRAYIQARDVQRRQGLPIGPLIYCFGSRYEASEFLYGEELKAYERDGLITLLTAFSRDQKHKIYIQDRIREHSATIAKLLTASNEADKGYACLCGPTWPVPDVTQALIDGFTDQGMPADEATAKIESLKEEERYVLEVY